MRCKYCKIEIEGQTTVCPLCQEKLRKDEPERQEAPFYPPKVPRNEKKHTHFTFTNVYLVSSVILFFISLAVALTVTPQVQWFWLVALLALYGYVLVRNTVMSSHSIGVRVFLQAFLISALLLSAHRIFEPFNGEQPNWALEFGLPCVLLISELVMTVLTAVFAKRKPSVLLDCVSISAILGFIPLILFGAGVISDPLLSAICGAISMISIICCIGFGRRELAEELKKKLHM